MVLWEAIFRHSSFQWRKKQLWLHAGKSSHHNSTVVLTMVVLHLHLYVWLIWKFFISPLTIRSMTVGIMSTSDHLCILCIYLGTANSKYLIKNFWMTEWENSYIGRLWWDGNGSITATMKIIWSMCSTLGVRASLIYLFIYLFLFYLFYLFFFYNATTIIYFLHKSWGWLDSTSSPQGRLLCGCH